MKTREGIETIKGTVGERMKTREGIENIKGTVGERMKTREGIETIKCTVGERVIEIIDTVVNGERLLVSAHVRG
jgi:hypothetical protein